MKKYLILLIIPIAGFILSSCDSTSDPTNPPSVTKGSIFVQSTPAGATIAVGGTSTR